MAPGTDDTTSPLLNGLHVLEAFTVDEPLLGVSEIARKVNLHKSSVSRILATLQRAGYVDRHPGTGRYLLGTALLGLAGPLLAGLDVRQLAFPILEDLARTTGETAALTIWNGHDSVVVEQVPSLRQVKHTAALGTRYETPESSSVQVFLASMPEDRARTAVTSQERAGAVPASEANGLLEMLAAVRTRGYAVNDGRTSPEEVGISAPILDHRGAVTAAVLLSAPRFRVDTARLESLAHETAAAAAEISSRLGHVAGTTFGTGPRSGPSPNSGSGAGSGASVIPDMAPDCATGPIE